MDARVNHYKAKNKLFPMTMNQSYMLVHVTLIIQVKNRNVS